jgi:TonB family protein
MRMLALVVAVCACGHARGHAPPPVPLHSGLPRLLPPLPADPAARGAAYLNRVALQLQPGWGQFLDDCRLRLPASHALNTMSLAATAELTIDRHGRVTKLDLASSGNPDFDEAVRDAIRDASPLPAPPVELMSDDDQVHLRWLFARDRRQAGPATAEVMTVELPVGPVVDRLLAAGDLARAARRVEHAQGSERTSAIERIAVAALREALGSAESASRRAAVEAIGRAQLRELAPEVRGLLATTTDTELRVVAIGAALALEDTAAARPLLAALPGDLPEHPRLALAETRALAGLGHRTDAAAILAAALAKSGSPNTIALQALALAPVPALGGKLVAWMQHGDARTRAGVCAALAGADARLAWTWIGRGLRDADASVRVACADAAAARAGTRGMPAVVPRLRALQHDRDRTVRAHALAALAALDPAHVVRAADDDAAEVRLAFAASLASGQSPSAAADLRQLIDDRDADVRAAAWASLVALPAAPADLAALAARAVRDAAPQVRRAALPALEDDHALARIAASDDAPEVRSAATVTLAHRRGRAASEADLLEQLAAAPPGSTDRVRAALAWLLAR